MTASTAIRDGVAVITVDNPPVNSMSLAARQGIAAGMQQALADPSVQAIVLTGKGKSFCAGAEIKEFNTPAAFAEPSLGTVIDVDRELAEAGRGRDQRHRDGRRPRARARLPLSRGGQAARRSRCPRSSSASCRAPAARSGCRAWSASSIALNMIVSGTPVPSDMLAPTALFDRMVDSHDDIVDSAVAFAKEVADKLPPPKIRDIRDRLPAARRLLRVRAQHRQGGREELSGAAEVRRRGRGGGHEALRRRPRVRARVLPRARADAGIEGAAARVLRRARGVEDSRRARRHADARRSSRPR